MADTQNQRRTRIFCVLRVQVITIYLLAALSQQLKEISIQSNLRARLLRTAASFLDSSRNYSRVLIPHVCPFASMLARFANKSQTRITNNKRILTHFRAKIRLYTSWALNLRRRQIAVISQTSYRRKHCRSEIEKKFMVILANIPQMISFFFLCSQ